MSEQGATGAPDTGASETDVFAGIESFDYEGGELRAVYAEKEEDEQPESEAATEQEQEADPDPEPASVPQDRYDNLRSWATRTAQENSRLREELAYRNGENSGKQPKETKPVAEPAVDPLELLSDPSKFNSFVQGEISRGIQEGLAPYQEHFLELEVQSEYRDALANLPGFFEMQPLINRVLDVVPSANLAEAYRIAKTFASGGDRASEAGAPAATQPPRGTPGTAPAAAPSRKVNVGELQQRAARNPETGVSGTPLLDQPKREANSFAEAYEQAERDWLASRRR